MNEFNNLNEKLIHSVSYPMVTLDTTPTPLVIFEPKTKSIGGSIPVGMVTFYNDEDSSIEMKQSIGDVQISSENCNITLFEAETSSINGTVPVQMVVFHKDGDDSMEAQRSTGDVQIPKNNDTIQGETSVDEISTLKHLNEALDKHTTAAKTAQRELKEKAKMLPNVQEAIDDSSFTFDGFNLRINESVVCNFSLAVQEEIIIVNANSSQRYSKYKAKVIVAYSVFETIVPGEEFDQFSWVKRLTSGKAFIIGDPADYRLYIRHLISYSKAKITFQYDRSGWVLFEKKYCYMTSIGPIGLKDKNMTTADGKIFRYNPELAGKEEIYRHILNLMNNMCKDNEKSIVLELFTHLGVLTTPFAQAGFPPKFVMGLIGETNSRKTSLAIAATQLFNRNSSHTPELSFTSTIGGIETMLQTYSDAVLLVDDLMPANTARQQYDLISKLEFLVRAYGDRVAKKRMTDFNHNGLQDSYPIRGTCLVTGEYTEGVTSSMTRMVNILLDRKQVNNEILSFHQKNSNILSTHFYDFLNYVTKSYDEIVRYIENRIPVLRRQGKGYFNIERYAESYAHLQTVSEIFLDYGLSRGFIGIDENNIYLNLFEEAIRKIIGINDNDVAKKNAGMMFLIALRSYIENGTLKSLGLNDSPIPGSEYIFVDHEHIYIRLENAYLLSKKYWTSYGKYLPLTSEDQLIQFLIPLGVIVERLEGKKIRHTLKLPKRKSGDNTRYLHIIKSVMNEKLEGVQEL